MSPTKMINAKSSSVNADSWNAAQNSGSASSGMGVAVLLAW